MKTVLVVDPNEDDRFIACTVLRNAGYAVVEARDAGEALSLLQGGGVDAIVSALALHDLSCPRFVRRLKENPATRETPVVIASNYWDVLPKEASELDVAARLQKPVTSTHLAQVIAQLIGPPDVQAE